jgi:hypothetical protein
MDQVKSYLRERAAAEKSLNRALRRFFRQQNARILEGLGNAPAPSLVPLAFQEVTETELLLAAIEDPMLGIMAAAAARVLKESANAPRQSKAFSFSPFKLPGRVITAIQGAFTSLKAAPFWTTLQANYSTSLTDTLETMISEGLSFANMKKRLKSIMSGMSSRRAEAVSITETTAAMGAAHQASYDYLADEGLLAMKEWVPILDRRVRADHRAMSGVRVAAKEKFTLPDGSQAMQPGDPNLPGDQRIRCRCVSIGVFEDLAGEE